MSFCQDLVREFIKACETMDLSPELAHRLLDHDYLQTEYPNLLNRQGQTSNFADTLGRMTNAKVILRQQSYEIASLIESDGKVVLECRWHGEMKIDAGSLKAGQKLSAFFCMVFEFKNQKIYRIRNYDCFEPF